MDEQAVAALVGMAGVPAVIGLTEVVKRTVRPRRRYWAALAVAIGLAVNLGFGWLFGMELRVQAAVGLIVGLAATGLYDATHAASRDAAAPPAGGM